MVKKAAPQVEKKPLNFKAKPAQPKVNRAERAKKQAEKKALKGMKVPRGTARNRRRELNAEIERREAEVQRLRELAAA